MVVLSESPFYEDIRDSLRAFGGALPLKARSKNKAGFAALVSSCCGFIHLTNTRAWVKKIVRAFSKAMKQSPKTILCFHADSGNVQSLPCLRAAPYFGAPLKEGAA